MCIPVDAIVYRGGDEPAALPALALRRLEVTATPNVVYAGNDSTITLTLRDITSASTATSVQQGLVTTIMVGTYSATATVGKGGVVKFTLPGEVVTGSRLVGVVIVPSYQKATFTLIVKPAPLKGNGLGDQDNLVIQLEIGSTLCKVNGKVLRLQPAPYIKSGRTMVPIRFFSDILGYRVDYNFTDPSMKQIMIYTPEQSKKDTPFISMFIDQSAALIGGILVDMDATPELVNGTAMVPLRFVAESLGYSVQWKNPNLIVLEEN
jgi:hypothetical protein